MDKEKWQSWEKNKPWNADYTRLLQVEGRVASEHVEMLWELTLTQWLGEATEIFQILPRLDSWLCGRTTANLPFAKPSCLPK